MSTILQLNESTIESISRGPGDVVLVRFAPAILIKSQGIPGVDASTRWIQGGELRITEAELDGEPGTLPAVPASGSMECGGYKYVDMMPVPLAGSGFAQLKLSFTAGAGPVLVTGEDAVLSMAGDPRYVEHIKQTQPPG